MVLGFFTQKTHAGTPGNKAQCASGCDDSHIGLERTKFCSNGDVKTWLPPDSGKYLSIGVEMAAGFLAGMFLGYQADKKFSHFPLWTIVGTVGGISAGFYNLYVKLRKP